MSDPGPYRRRRVTPIGLHRPIDGWRFKLYAITETGGPPAGELLGSMRTLVDEVTERTAVGDESTYGVGFACVHEAGLFHQVIVDWWARENELRHHVFRSASVLPPAFEPITASGEAFCVWELALLAFERRQWLRRVLECREGPDYEAYLSDRLEGLV